MPSTIFVEGICGGSTWAKGKPPANRDNEMRKEKTIRSITSFRLIVSQAVIALLLVAATAGAQTDAGKDKKDRPFFDVKSSTPISKAPSSLSQQYEKEGMLVEFSMNAIQSD